MPRNTLPLTVSLDIVDVANVEVADVNVPVIVVLPADSIVAVVVDKLVLPLTARLVDVLLVIVALLANRLVNTAVIALSKVEKRLVVVALVVVSDAEERLPVAVALPEASEVREVFSTHDEPFHLKVVLVAVPVANVAALLST